MNLINHFSLREDGMPGWTRRVYEHAGQTVYIDRQRDPRLVDVFVVSNGLYCLASWKGKKARLSWGKLEAAVLELLEQKATE